MKRFYAHISWTRSRGSEINFKENPYGEWARVDEVQAEIDKLKSSINFWKTTAINLDGKYQNWIE